MIGLTVEARGSRHVSSAVILHVHVILIIAQPLRRVLRSPGACPPHPPAAHQARQYTGLTGGSASVFAVSCCSC